MTYKVILALCLSVATAFQAQVAPKVSRTSMQLSIDEVKSDSGVSAPFGYFDPAGLMSNSDQLDEAYSFYKEVEIKHGRVAMLAALGFLVGEKFHPLFGGDIDTPSYVAFQQTPLQKFWPIVVAAIGFIEFKTSVPTFEDPDVARWKVKTDRVAGDLGFDPLGMKPKDAAGLKSVATKEINNGRLAMLAIAGMVGQELATGMKL